tara:strand:- start:70 stop:519 length:450 start_codon:yes stop_codon:yes gene_type:complete
MAIARGAGTEIIRSVHADDIDDTVSNLIVGIQYHIYTVLSVIFNMYAIQADGNFVRCYIQGYDVKVGATDQHFTIFRQDMSVNNTYVWNDKFSFNGHEPVDFTGPLSTAAMQDAIADQGSAVKQYLRITTENASDSGHVTCTYIDQNNA